MASAAVFEYSSQGLTRAVTQPSGTTNDQFDSFLCQLWEQRMKEGVFAYNLDAVKRKLLPGDFRIYLQLNEKRFSQRRKPAVATQVLMPFDDQKFNFTKIKDTEILFHLKRTEDKESTDRIVVNVFPIEYGHVLLLPQCDARLPQALTPHAVGVALRVCLLSTHKGFVAGFNGLCALASVNHLHVQIMYLQQPLPIASAQVNHLSRNVFSLENYMVNGFMLQLTDVGCVGELSEDVVRITSYLCEQNIPLNVVMCKRKMIQSSNVADHGAGVETAHNSGDYVTVFIIPKKPSPEMTDDPFNCAFLEVAGYIPMKEGAEYESITEEDVLGVIAKYTWSSTEFQVLKQQIIDVLST